MTAEPGRENCLGTIVTVAGATAKTRQLGRRRHRTDETDSGEVPGQGIQVNAVCPGPIDTRMIHSLEAQPNPADPTSMGRRYQSAILIGRYVTPDEIANTILFLCSDLASAIGMKAFISLCLKFPTSTSLLNRRKPGGTMVIPQVPRGGCPRPVP